jgi:SAM-dependent methyltransferase
MIHAEVDIIREAYNNSYMEEVARTSSIQGKNEFALVTSIINKYIKEKDIIYDLGSGNGRFTDYYSKKGHMVGCLELSEKLLNYSMNHYEISGNSLLFRKNCCVSNIDWIPSESSDLCVIMGPFYHITDLIKRKTTISHLNRIIKKDGLLIVQFLNTVPQTSSEVLKNYRIRKYTSYTDHAISYTYFGGYLVPQFRCNTEFAIKEFKPLFDVEEIRQLYHNDQNIKDLSYGKRNAKIRYNDQYLVVLRKKKR